MSDEGEFEFDNPRVRGKYRIAREAYELIQKKQDTELSRKMMSWIIGEHLSGQVRPLVTIDVLSEIQTAKPLGFGDRVKRLLNLAIVKKFQPSDHFRIAGQVDNEYREGLANLCDWLDIEERHISGFFQLTEQMGLTRHANSNVYLTARGFEKIDELQSSNIDSQQAFVAMWFDPHLHEFYEKGVAPAIRAAGYTPMRIDKKQHNNKIDDEIIAEIKRSKFIVADFTCAKIETKDGLTCIPRGGVYFEAGFATGLGIPVIWMCREDLIGDVHFDTRQFAHIVWTTFDGLRKDLYNRICATIGERPRAPGLSEEA